MPLIKSSSPKAFKTNVRTLMHEVGKSPHIQSRKQALAIAYETSRRAHKAYGGPNFPKPPGQPKLAGLKSGAYKPPKETTDFAPEKFGQMETRASLYGLRHEGMIHSSIPGRTDKLPMKVPSGSYVLPADVPSALGQGNSAAGGSILKKMFSSGPYGMGLPGKSPGVHPPRLNLNARPAGGNLPLSMLGKGNPAFADGGTNDEHEGSGDSHVPIIAAGGEYIIHPAVVRAIGGGDIKRGHRALDAFVLKVRKEHIKTLKKLPGPKR